MQMVTSMNRIYDVLDEEPVIADHVHSRQMEIEGAFSFENVNLRDAHPNTSVLTVWGKAGNQVKVQASSLGGGRIMVNQIDGIRVDFTGEKPTLIVQNEDIAASLALLSSRLAERDR